MSEIYWLPDPASTAIACSTGGFKGVFIAGVLDAFEEASFRAGAYAAASSSVLPAAAAAAGHSRRLGLDHWLAGLRLIGQPGIHMSAMVQTGIAENEAWLKASLFEARSARFLIAVSAVDAAGAEETQSRQARRRGRQLLLDAARGDRSWVDDHLALQLFDTAANVATKHLTAANFADVAYASSRMLHAWDIPAWIDGRPYVDAFYTCACPAVEMAELGFKHVIALATEPVLYCDIFQDNQMPTEWRGRPIHTIAPEIDPAGQGVSYTNADPEGLTLVYEHGRMRGDAFLKRPAG